MYLLHKWQVNIPSWARLSFKHLNVVGFFEVMDFSWFSDWLKTVPYLQDLLKYDGEGLGGSAADLSSSYARLGSGELLSNLAFPLLLATILAVLCCLLTLLSVAFPSQQIDQS